MSGSSGARSLTSDPAITVSVLGSSGLGVAELSPQAARAVVARIATRRTARGDDRRFTTRSRAVGAEAVDGRALGLVGPDAIDVGLGLLDLAGERRHRLLHRVERLELECVDLIHRRVDVVERGLELRELDRR